MINIVYEDNHLLIVEKTINVPVQGDSSNDLDFLTILKQFIKKRDNKPGNVYLGLVHRLDRPVGGIMVFAKTSKCAARLSKQVQNHDFKKTYFAVVMHKIIKKCDTFIDYLLKDEKKNIVKIDKNGKKAILDYELIDYKDNMSLVKINLQTGRSHQIRVQFSSRGYPLYGDHKYNPEVTNHSNIALFATTISFYHPITNEYLIFNLNLPKTYPWNLFSHVDFLTKK
ncbi:MAG: RNA pseudouridine synthase [Bacilli bacterium]|nr:RNA pseudouridine synthase [Bacilli bacterium]